MTVTWQAPQALTHRNWHESKDACQFVFQSGSDLVIDWQACQQVDSSAIAMVLELRRHVQAPIQHLHASLQLKQLAALYEVGELLGL